jgi:hypothetical protein
MQKKICPTDKTRVVDPYLFNTDPDPDPAPKVMQIHADPDPHPWIKQIIIIKLNY